MHSFNVLMFVLLIKTSTPSMATPCGRVNPHCAFFYGLLLISKLLNANQTAILKKEKAKNDLTAMLTLIQLLTVIYTY